MVMFQHHVALGGVSRRLLCPRLEKGAPQIVQSIKLPGGPRQCQVVLGIMPCTGHLQMMQSIALPGGLEVWPAPRMVAVPVQGPVKSGGVHS